MRSPTRKTFFAVIIIYIISPPRKLVKEKLVEITPFFIVIFNKLFAFLFSILTDSDAKSIISYIEITPKNRHRSTAKPAPPPPTDTVKVTCQNANHHPPSAVHRTRQAPRQTRQISTAKAQNPRGKSAKHARQKRKTRAAPPPFSTRKTAKSATNYRTQLVTLLLN